MAIKLSTGAVESPIVSAILDHLMVVEAFALAGLEIEPLPGMVEPEHTDMCTICGTFFTSGHHACEADF